MIFMSVAPLGSAPVHRLRVIERSALWASTAREAA